MWGDKGVIYEINTTGADSYIWTVPAGATIITQTDTGLKPFITVDWDSNIGGNICVIAVTDGCESTPTCYAVTLNDVPPAAGTININGN